MYGPLSAGGGFGCTPRYVRTPDLLTPWCISDGAVLHPAIGLSEHGQYGPWHYSTPTARLAPLLRIRSCSRLRAFVFGLGLGLLSGLFVEMAMRLPASSRADFSKISLGIVVSLTATNAMPFDPSDTPLAALEWSDDSCGPV